MSEAWAAPLDDSDLEFGDLPEIAVDPDARIHVGDEDIESLTNLKLRRFQRALAATAVNRALAGQAITTAWVSAGSGKTYAWQLVALWMLKAGVIDFVAVYAPRKNLQDQAERDWNQLLLECETVPPGIGEIPKRENVLPLVVKGDSGFVSTYQSLVSGGKNVENSSLHRAWARENKGRFLLILDEAQFIGDTDGDGDGGTKAAAEIKEIQRQAYATVLLTATPRRSDSNKIALAEYSTEGRLLYDARATYSEGVIERYLKPTLFDLNDGDGTLELLFPEGRKKEQFEIETYERGLTPILRHPKVWQPIVDKTIAALLDRRTHCSEYTALIATIDQDHAREVEKYAKRTYPNLQFVRAISDDDETARNRLRQFRPEEKGGRADGDVLITVGMAYIGYDCPSISVVGILSRNRWGGWLEQLIMRGGRIWSKRPVNEQMLIVVAPHDKEMVKFANDFRADSEAALKERERRDTGQNLSEGPVITVTDVNMTGSVTMGIAADGSLDFSAEETIGLREIQNKMGLEPGPVPDAITIAKAYRVAGYPIPSSGAKAEQKTASPETKQERLTQYSRDVRRKLSKRILNKNPNLSTDSQAFQTFMRSYNNKLNLKQRVKSVKYLTEAQWIERLALVDRLIIA